MFTLSVINTCTTNERGERGSDAVDHSVAFLSEDTRAGRGPIRVTPCPHFLFFLPGCPVTLATQWHTQPPSTPLLQRSQQASGNWSKVSERESVHFLMGTHQNNGQLPSPRCLHSDVFSHFLLILSTYCGSHLFIDFYTNMAPLSFQFRKLVYFIMHEFSKKRDVADLFSSCQTETLELWTIASPKDIEPHVDNHSNFSPNVRPFKAPDTYMAINVSFSKYHRLASDI